MLNKHTAVSHTVTIGARSACRRAHAVADNHGIRGSSPHRVAIGARANVRSAAGEYTSTANCAAETLGGEQSDCERDDAGSVSRWRARSADCQTGRCEKHLRLIPSAVSRLSRRPRDTPIRPRSRRKSHDVVEYAGAPPSGDLPCRRSASSCDRPAIGVDDCRRHDGSSRLN